MNCTQFVDIVPQPDGNFIFASMSDDRLKIDKVFGGTLTTGGKVICFDSKKFMRYSRHLGELIDLKYVVSSTSDTFYRLVKELKPEGWQRFVQLHSRMRAHLNAISSAKIESENIQLLELIPMDFLREYYTSMFGIMSRLSSTIDTHEWTNFTLPLLKSLTRIEKNGVRVDTDFLSREIKKQHPRHIVSFMTSMLDQAKDGFLYSKLDPSVSRTRRMGVESGFQCMSIPHGAPRQAIISRYPDGEIWSYDFNAIDYRCLVRYVDDNKLNALYGGVTDFHNATALHLFGDMEGKARKIAKDLTYVTVYGGSLETLQKKLLLPQIKIQELLGRMKDVLDPIVRVRTDLAERARKDGFIETPGGFKIAIQDGDHDGKILGLFAQSFSSYVFGKALCRIVDAFEYSGLESKILFPVHDEIVVDVHPEEKEKLIVVSNEMTRPVLDMVPAVKVRRGKTYGEATDT